ncbi:unnamed protein product [Trichobilharzia regenti]|nr:unnamed protein product [Trichobilharzia regenti]
MGEAKYEHESRSINCPSTVLQVVCCPQTPRCILLVCSTGWQMALTVDDAIYRGPSDYISLTEQSAV